MMLKFQSISGRQSNKERPFLAKIIQISGYGEGGGNVLAGWKKHSDGEGNEKLSVWGKPRKDFRHYVLLPYTVLRRERVT